MKLIILGIAQVLNKVIMYFANKHYLFYITLIVFPLKIYSQYSNEAIKRDTIYINFTDSPKTMEKTRIIEKNIFEKSQIEINHFYVYLFDGKKNDGYYFQLTNTKSKSSIKKISNHVLKKIDSKIILDYNFINSLGYHKTMDLLKDKKIFIIEKEPSLFKCIKIYEAKILNYSSLSN